VKIGVLAVQGAFIEHEHILARIGAEPVEVRLPEHLKDLDGLIVPGGESTTISQVAERWGLLEPLRAFGRSGRPVWGTCAGMILMAKEVTDSKPGQRTLELMDIAVRRNAFGRQVDSFEADLNVPALGGSPFHAVFIRAPLVERVGKGVDVVTRLEDGTVVAARQGNLLATAFHPELTEDDRFHRYFLSLSGMN
jgi:5'-phosphate synthase pdxT subunit